MNKTLYTTNQLQLYRLNNRIADVIDKVAPEALKSSVAYQQFCEARKRYIEVIDIDFVDNIKRRLLKKDNWIYHRFRFLYYMTSCQTHIGEAKDCGVADRAMALIMKERKWFIKRNYSKKVLGFHNLLSRLILCKDIQMMRKVYRENFFHDCRKEILLFEKFHQEWISVVLERGMSIEIRKNMNEAIKSVYKEARRQAKETSSDADVMFYHALIDLIKG